ncbi:S-adenosyl-L-methionine-dependent methyltransferase [Suillus ampliporus]|nr:S-adenosyl-L-methionine-dependent methyltransferase [Suillus ampliporus]
MATSVHPTAQLGFGTGTNELYDRVRPSYPSESLSYIRQIPKSTAPLNIVEIGAGTGIFTRGLLTHPEWATSISALRAVEPSDGMRDFWTKAVKDDRATIVNGTFDNTGVEDGWADLIIVAEAFHWCLDHGKALAEFARILKNEGAVVMIWNLEDREAEAWVAQLYDRRNVHEKDTPPLDLDLLRQAFSPANTPLRFHPLKVKELAYRAPTTDQIVIGRSLSWSYISVLPPDEKVKVVDDIKIILDRGDGKVWINKEEGTYEYPHTSLIAVSIKK